MTTSKGTIIVHIDYCVSLKKRFYSHSTKYFLKNVSLYNHSFGDNLRDVGSPETCSISHERTWIFLSVFASQALSDFLHRKLMYCLIIAFWAFVLSTIKYYKLTESLLCVRNSLNYHNHLYNCNLVKILSLTKTLIRLPWTLFQLGLDFWTFMFFLYLSNFNKHPAKSVWPECLIFHNWSILMEVPILHNPPSEVWSPWLAMKSCELSLARILPLFQLLPSTDSHLTPGL